MDLDREDVEGLAGAFLVGMLASGRQGPPRRLTADAFDLADAFVAEATDRRATADAAAKAVMDTAVQS